jgi:hypothetical protein
LDNWVANHRLHLHLHDVADVADVAELKGIDVILAGSYGDSVFRKCIKLGEVTGGTLA